jgi:hypothetical protein
MVQCFLINKVMVEIKSAKHPKTGELFSVGDRVCIYQGRFGHNNIITIKSMFTSKEHNGDEHNPEFEERVYVSETDSLPGSYLLDVKHKVSDKEFRALQKARNLVSKYI